MKILGIWLITIGAATVFVAFLIGNTISAEVPDFSLSSLTGSILTRHEEVANLPRLQLQTMVSQSGLALFLAGAVFTVGGTIVEHLGRQASHNPAADSPIPIADEEAQLPAAAENDIADADPEPDRHGWLLFVCAACLAALLALALVTAPKTRSTGAVDNPEVMSMANGTRHLPDPDPPQPGRHRHR